MSVKTESVAFAPNTVMEYLKRLILFVLLFLLCFVFTEKPYLEKNVRDAIGATADCFTVPGVILSGIGGLSYILGRGGFDTLCYSFFGYGLHNLLPVREKERSASLYEYKRKKEEQRKGWRPFSLLPGLVSLLVGAVLTAIYTVI